MASVTKSPVKRLVKAIVPASLRRDLKVRRARRELDALATIPCDAAALRPSSSVDLDAIWRDPEGLAAWDAVAPRLAELTRMAPAAAQSDGNRGVNPGDRKAIFLLVRALAPARVLEIGTNVGFSTLHIAASMPAGASITTVDIVDVNDPAEQPWRGSATPYTPRELMAAAGFAEAVRFVKSPSLDVLAKTTERFDLIFLDGSHDATVVYQEVPLALKALAPGGVILLHDFYPGHDWLWDNKVVIPGPCLAVDRLREEGVALSVQPFGALPWPTKLGSTVTSLALLTRAD